MKKFNSEHMISIGGYNHILDLDKFSELVNNSANESRTTDIETETKYNNSGTNIEPYETIVTTREFERAETVDAAKYDVIRMSLEILLTYNEEIDDTLGLNRVLEKAPISFKVAFNTLLNCGVLIVVESEY